MNRSVFRSFGVTLWVLYSGGQLSAQNQPSAGGEAPIHVQWQHADAQEDGLIGVSSRKALEEWSDRPAPARILVAVLDSGTEIDHPDLQEAIWVNADELSGNGKDDDGNGYVDDVNGWNFIGGPGGDVVHDNLEFTRVFAGLKKRFEGRPVNEVGSDEKADYQRYLKMTEEYRDRLSKAEGERRQVEEMLGFHEAADKAIREALGKETYTSADLGSIQVEDDFMSAAVDFMRAVLNEGLLKDIREYETHVNNQFNYMYNLDFDPRHMVGDDYSNPRERYYGNNHVSGEHADHGTHVAGIIAATHNDVGLDGICPACELMIIRCVPDGDERDKDVANAIRYAADNGARIINMSFGKSLSPEKEVVDEAVRYAESKGVLLIHAAGNDAKDVDRKANFPSDRYLDGKSCSTWIEVGASGPTRDQLCAGFSNYGRKNVDVFAPGVNVYSTLPGHSYDGMNGTSMAAPVVAGVAGALWSYFPELTAAEVKKILEESAVPYRKVKVPHPDTSKPVAFGKLSRTGGVVNLHEALKMADRMKKR